MRVLVIGGTGFIGPAVVSQLQRLGHEITLYHRGNRQAMDLSVNQILGDREHLAEHAGAFRKLSPDVVLDLILSSGRQAQALMSVFKGVAGRVVALSSIDVYRACGVLHGSEPGPLEPVPLTEDSSLRSQAIALAVTVDRAAGQIYNVAEPDNFSELEWTEKVAHAAGWQGRIVVVPTERAPAHLKVPGNPQQHWTVDSSRIRQQLGYREPVALEDALQATIAWERANPPEVDSGPFDYAAEDAYLNSVAGV